jgi:predicted phage tail protein
MPKKTTTKKTVAKKTVAKKATAKRTVAKKTVAKKAVTKADTHVENAYFWGGLAIALCAAGAFMVLAFGIGQMIR